MEQRKSIGSVHLWSLDIAFLLTFFMGIAYMSVTIVLVLDKPLHQFSLITATIILVAILGFIAYKFKWGLHFKWQSCLVAAWTVLASILISRNIYDTSYDGQIYHMLAISSLKENWNPIYNPGFPLSVWVQHYAKASWMLGSYLYVISSSIEAGKAINLIFPIASAFGAFAALTRVFPSKYGLFSAIAAILLAANPVVFEQLFSFYNDGLLASLLLLYISMLMYYSVSRCTKSLIAACIAMIILVNIKFTAVVYAGLATIFFLLFIAYKHRFRFKRVFLTMAFTGFLGIIMIGFNPYLTNIVQKGHPFYPLSGKGKIDIVTGNMPADFVGKSKWDKFILSLTGKPGSPVQPIASERRSSVWTVHMNEFKRIDQDTRVNGFGPFMLWILTGAFFLGVLLLFTDLRMTLAGGMFGLGLLVMVWINPEIWWARYVPHFWWLPFVVVICAWNSKRRITKASALLLMILIAVNTLGTGIVVVGKQIMNSGKLENQLTQLENKHLQILQQGSSCISVPIRFAEKNITFTQAPGDKICKKPETILFSTIQYCE